MAVNDHSNSKDFCCHCVGSYTQPAGYRKEKRLKISFQKRGSGAYACIASSCILNRGRGKVAASASVGRRE